MSPLAKALTVHELADVVAMVLDVATADDLDEAVTAELAGAEVWTLLDSFTPAAARRARGQTGAQAVAIVYLRTKTGRTYSLLVQECPQ